MKLTRSMPSPAVRRPASQVDDRPVRIVKEAGRKAKFFIAKTGEQITRYEAIQIMRAFKQGAAPQQAKEARKWELKAVCHDDAGSWVAFSKLYEREGSAQNMLVKLCNEASARPVIEQRKVTVSFSLTEVK